MGGPIGGESPPAARAPSIAAARAIRPLAIRPAFLGILILTAALALAVMPVAVADPDPAAPAATLRFDHFGQVSVLPLIDGELRTALAEQPLRLYRYAAGIGLATGRGLLVETEADFSIADPGLPAPMRAARPLADFGGRRYWLARTPDRAALDVWRARLAELPGVRRVWPDLLRVELGDAVAETVQPRYRLDEYSLVADLNLERAWTLADGRGTTVAVIDSGVDASAPGLERVEAIHLDAWPDPAFVPEPPPGRNHGTRVAGLIFAAHEDAIGAGRVRGIAPRARLVAIRLRSTWTSEQLSAFHLAWRAGADVIVCAWDEPLVPEPVAALLEFIAEHGRDGRGIAIVAAAGNRHYDSSAMLSLANLPSTLSVTALDHHDGVVAAYGRGVDLAAPSMLPTLPPRPDGRPSYLGKTSASAPLVAGTVALLLSVRPELRVADLREILRASAEPLPAAGPADTAAGSGWGFGKLAPVAALELAARPARQGPEAVQ